MNMKQNLAKDLDRRVFVNRADGDTAQPISAPEGDIMAANAAQLLGDIIAGPNRRRAGLRVNSVFFSLESILLAALLIVAIVALRRQ